MKKFYVPEIGDEIILEKDWTFELHSERRNDTMGEFFGYKSACFGSWIKFSDYHVYADFVNRMENESVSDYLIRRDKWHEELAKFSVKSITITIPKGCLLKIDRIYIRKGCKDYSSITFNVKKMGEALVKQSRWNDKIINKKSFRFWAKLSDCNNIIFE